MRFDFLQEATSLIRAGRNKGALGKREVTQGGNKKSATSLNLVP